MSGNDSLAQCLETAIEAVRRAAAILEEWHPRISVREKGRFDLVTEADLASQSAIQEYIRARHPSHGFVGEEGPAGVRPGPDAPPTWIVDPIDGTTNYVHDCPFYCISVGLMAEGELVLGVILDPVRDELFRATKDEGAWLGDRRLTTSASDRLGGALLATGFPPDLRGQERALAWWRFFSLRTQSLRRTGSTALNLAYVAAGRFDGYWGFDNHPWDIAAGVVLIREAGGLVTRADGSPHDPFAPDCLASNGPLHPELIQAFRADPRSS